MSEIQNKLLDMLEKLAIENLAALEHEQWRHWMMYLQEKKGHDGALVTFTMEEWAEWIRKAAIPYSELTDKEKESDRVWAKKVLEKLGLDDRQMLAAYVSGIWSANPLLNNQKPTKELQE